jgi:F-type H+-transporting ATPase subunit epsilon
VAEMSVELVAVERPVWSGQASSVFAVTTVGELGILPGHTPLLGVLIEGEVTIESLDGARYEAKVDGGFLSVDSDVVTIVAEKVDASSLHSAGL